MNRKRVQKLRDHVSRIPEEQFAFDVWFRENSATPASEVPPCGTIACLAGHTIILFREVANYYLRANKDGRYRSMSSGAIVVGHLAQRILGITDKSRFQLFVKNSRAGTRDDAIARLDYLLEHGSMNGYDFSTEPNTKHFEKLSPACDTQLAQPELPVRSSCRPTVGVV